MKKKVMPLVSIIVPAYCHEKYIDDCLKSIYEQTYENIEVIITDDCSTDSTFDRIGSWKEKLKERFKNVDIIRNDVNLGVVKTLNNMIKRTKGKYIKSIASDDFLLHDAIFQLVQYIETLPFDDLIFSNAIYISETDHFPLNNYENYKLGYRRPPNYKTDILEKIYENNFILAPTVLFRRNVFEKLGYFDEELTIEDWEYWLRVAKHGKISYCNEITVGYRIVKNSLSHFVEDTEGRKKLCNMFDNQMKILDKYKPLVESHWKKGYEKLCQRTLHEAIDLKHDELIETIFFIIKDKQLIIDTETQFKYYFYKLNILWLVQGMKKVLGLKTVENYKIEK